jgi:hypothetical protein
MDNIQNCDNYINIPNSGNSMPFIKVEDSFPYSQAPTTGLQTQNITDHIFMSYLFKIHFNVSISA